MRLTHWVSNDLVRLELLPNLVVRHRSDGFPALIKARKYSRPIPFRHDIQVVSPLDVRAKDIARMEKVLGHRAIHDAQSIVIDVLENGTEASHA